MNAIATFPTDLATAPAKGYVEINRSIALLIREFMPHTQAARLVLRAAALQACAHVPADEVAQAMRAVANEIEGVAV